MADNITFDDIRRNGEIKTYIERGDEVMCAIGYTEHSFAHAMRTADISRRILEELGYDDRYCELVQIASYMHEDIGNAVNRVNPCSERRAHGVSDTQPPRHGPVGDD